MTLKVLSGLFYLSFAIPHACVVPASISVAGYSEPCAGVAFSNSANAS